MKKFVIMSLSLMVLLLVGCSGASSSDGQGTSLGDISSQNQNARPGIGNNGNGKNYKKNKEEVSGSLDKIFRIYYKEMANTENIHVLVKAINDVFPKIIEAEKSIALEFDHNSSYDHIDNYVTTLIIKSYPSFKDELKNIIKNHSSHEVREYSDEEIKESLEFGMILGILIEKHDGNKEKIMEEVSKSHILQKRIERELYRLEEEDPNRKYMSLETPTKSVKKEILELKTRVAANTKRIEEVSKENRQGIALTTAMAQINPLGMNEGKFSAGVGMGYFKGETGLAFGVGYGISEGISLSSKGAFATSDFSTFAIGAGMNFEF